MEAIDKSVIDSQPMGQERQEEIRQLSDVQLALIGGGIGDVVWG